MLTLFQEYQDPGQYFSNYGCFGHIPVEKGEKVNDRKHGHNMPIDFGHQFTLRRRDQRRRIMLITAVFYLDFFTI
jgi:hypothetical protein